MGCKQSKKSDVDFTAVDNRREELGLEPNGSRTCNARKSSVIGSGQMLESLAKQAKPIMDYMILTDATPKLSKQVVATAAVVMGTKVSHKYGAQHLKNVFAPPLDDVYSFTAPIFPKTIEEKQLIRNALKTNFVFAACTERELRTIIDAFEEFDFSINEKIIVQGDVGDYFYVLKTGNVRFEVNEKVVANASTGATFGELALLYSSPRSASAIAESNFVQLYRVDQKSFRYIMQSQTMKTEKAKKELLEGVKFLNFLEGDDINKLVHTMVPRVFHEGEYITRNGAEGDTLYVIQEGNVRVTDVPVFSVKKENQELGPGDHFGETALLHKEEHAKSATVVGISKGLLLSIDRKTFEKVVGDIGSLAVQAEDQRILAEIPILKNSNLPKPIFASLASLFVEKTYPPNSKIISEGATTTSATLYIVRSGQVTLKSKSGMGKDEVVESGCYFGEAMFEIDIEGLKTSSGYNPRYYAEALSNPVVVGTLSIECCRNVIDTTSLGKKNNSVAATERIDIPIAMEELERHTILGAGTFGQVWLVSHMNSGRERQPYALKIQSKYELIKSHQAKGVVQEKKIMDQLHHPFLTHLAATYQDDKCIYMLLGLVQGGELYSILHSTTRDGIDEKDATFYASGILEGLSHMHRSHILYRDIKPENIMIDREGYPVIIDFGFAKFVKAKTYTLCGTPLYLAPEVILNRGHDKGADHWSYGVLAFEMLEGKTPFYMEGMDQIQLFRCICKGKYKFPLEGVMSPEMEDLIQRLFVVDPAQRIGSLAKGINEIYTHPWFQDIDFGKLRHKQLDAPWVPDIKDALDTHNFETWDHLTDQTKNDVPAISSDQQRIFTSF